MRRTTLIGAVSLVITFGFLVGTAEAQKEPKEPKITSVMVDCSDPKQSIQSAVNHAIGPTTIFAIGDCDGFTIRKDDITVSGNSDGSNTQGGAATIDGTIEVDDADRFVLEYLTITGPGLGIVVDRGSSGEVTQNLIQDNARSGLGVFGVSYVTLVSNRITGNGRNEPPEGPIYFDGGVDVDRGAIVRSDGNYIADNSYGAVQVGGMGVFRNGAFIPVGGTPDPSLQDVYIQRGCAQGDPAGNCTAANLEHAVFELFRTGLLHVRNGDVTGNVFVTASYFSIRTSTLNGNIDAGANAVLQIKGTVFGSGLVSCGNGARTIRNVACGESIPPPP